MNPNTDAAANATQEHRPFAVALTGGIGSGKSAVAKLFSELGVTVIDADVISHALTAPGGAALPAITQRFGPRILDPDGALNRSALRAQVFSDPAARRDLERILHPIIRATMLTELAADSGAYAILAIPLLIETGQTELADRVLVVDAPESLRVERVCRRSGLAPDEVHRIIHSQAATAERLAFADDIIDNSGALAALQPQVERLHRHYLDLAARSI